MRNKQTYSIRITPELMTNIKIQAAKKNISISTIVENAVKNYLGDVQNAHS